MNRLLILLTLLLSHVVVSAAILTTPDKASAGDWYCFRGKVNIENPDNIKEVRIAADSKYWLWIDGELVVFEGGLKRGPSPTESYEDRFEGGFKALGKGEHQIPILVWYFGKESFSHRNSPTAGVSFEIDFGGQIIESNATWRVSKAPGYYTPTETLPNYRLPESNVGFDARFAESWSDPDYDDSKWSRVKVVYDSESSGWGKFVERPIPMWRDYGLQNYAEIVREEGRIIAKLPYNCQFTPYLKVRAKAGAKIDIRTDNYMGGGVENVYAEYITKHGIQEYESYGWMNGHEVHYTIPEGVEVISLMYRETGYDADFVGQFVCDDEFYNTLWLKAQRTLYVTMRDTYMDCPDRERAQWWGDVVNELGEAFYVFDAPAHELTRKAILELMNFQRADGSIYSPVPSSNWDKELPMQMLASVGYYGFWTYYMGSGDRETIEEVYPKVKRYLNLWQVGNDGLVVQRKGGWMWGDWGNNKDMTLLFNLWYIIALDGYEHLAHLVGDAKEAERVSKISSRLRSRFHAEFWSGSYYISPNYKRQPDDRAQALAVIAGVLPKELYETIRPFFRENYNASPYMEKYVLQALCEMGYHDDALARMKYRFSDMVESEYTTLWEGWSVGDKAFGGGSYNHAWSGGCLTILSQYFAGISALEPQFKRFEIKPNLGSLKSIRSTTPTPFGNIEMLVEQNDESMDILLIVPKSTTALFVAPSWAKRIKGGGDGKSRIFNLKSGMHRISIKR